MTHKVNPIESSTVNPVAWVPVAPTRVLANESVNKSALKGWGRTLPSQVNSAQIPPILVGIETIQLFAVVTPVTPIVKPVVVIGLQRSKELEILLDLAESKAEARSFINAANAGNPSVKDFKKQINVLIEKKRIEIALQPKMVEEVVKSESVNTNFVHTIRRCLSDIVLVAQVKMNKETKKLQKEVNLIEDAANDKAAKDRAEKRKEAFKKQKVEERIRWDNFLAKCGITQALHTLLFGA